MVLMDVKHILATFAATAALAGTGNAFAQTISFRCIGATPGVDKTPLNFDISNGRIVENGTLLSDVKNLVVTDRYITWEDDVWGHGVTRIDRTSGVMRVQRKENILSATSPEEKKRIYEENQRVFEYACDKIEQPATKF